MPLARTIAAIVLAALPAAPAGATGPVSDRLYLVAADSSQLGWSPDPSDPESDLTEVRRTCGHKIKMGGDAEPCGELHTLATATSQYFLSFNTLALLGEPITWSPADPLRFHVEMSANTAGLPFTIKFYAARDGGLWESPPATEVAPGVWEGALGTGLPLTPGFGRLLGVEIVTQARRVQVTMRVRGASWVDLPAPVAVQSVRELLAQSTYAPAPSTLETRDRAFEFNDDAWSVRSYTGDLSVRQTFTWTEPEPAAFVLAWTEVPGRGAVYDPLRGSQPDHRTLFEYPVPHLLWGTKEVAGNYSVAGLSIPAGDVSVRVHASTPYLPESRPYTLYVLTVRGARTLSWMHWVMPETHSANANLPPGAPQLQVCASGGLSNPVPVTAEATTFSLDVDWDAATPQPARWSPALGVNGCPSGFTGDTVRVVHQGAFVWFVGATTDAAASAQDTRLEMTMRLAYTPAP